MLKAFGARVVITPVKESSEMQKAASGLYIPSKLTSTDDKFVRGVIVSLGEGRLTDRNERVAIPLTVGATVVYNKFNAAEILGADGVIYAILDEGNVLAVEEV